MTKKVFDNHQTAHVWAQRVGYGVRSHNGNLYSSEDGETIFSYGSHFPIAKFWDLPSGGVAVFLTTQSYSVSTARHISYVWSALANRRIFRVPAPWRIFRVPAPRHSPARQVTDFREAMLAALELASECTPRQKKRREGYLDHAAALVRTANEIAEAFNIDERLELPDDVNKYLADAWEAAARQCTEREYYQTLADRAWIADNQDYIEEWCRGNWNAGGHWNAAKIDRLFGMLSPEQKAAREQTMERGAEAWKNHVRDDENRLPMPDRTLLRLTQRDAIRLADRANAAQSPLELRRIAAEADEPWEIETSLGARFPVDHAVKAFKVLARMKATGLLPFSRSDFLESQTPTIRLGHFTIDKVDEHGNVTAGCHFVEWCEIEDMARRLGLIDTSLEAATTEVLRNIEKCPQPCRYFPGCNCGED